MIGGWEGSSYSFKRVQTDMWVESWDYPNVWGTKLGTDLPVWVSGQFWEWARPIRVAGRSSTRSRSRPIRE